VQLVISDHHFGLKEAIGAVFVGATWQLCRVHFICNVLARVSKASAEMVAAAIGTIFAQPDAAHVHAQLDEVARMLDSKFPDVAAMLRDASEDLLAFTSFPVAHWRKTWSNNPLERINGEIKRRTNVVGIFPNDASIMRLVTAVLVETHDEWAVAERRYLSEETMAKIGEQPRPSTTFPSPSPRDTLNDNVDDHKGADLHHPAAAIWSPSAIARHVGHDRKTVRAICAANVRSVFVAGSRWRVRSNGSRPPTCWWARSHTRVSVAAGSRSR
jgi:hypothetical protein